MILAVGLLAACNVPRTFEGPRPPAVTVQAGESLLDISRRYDVSMTELIALNGIQAPYQVQPGQTLSLPQAGGFAGTVPSTVAAAPGGTPPAALPPLPPPSGQLGAAPPVGSQQPATIPPLPPAASAPASIIPGSAPASPGTGSGTVTGGVQVEPLPPPSGTTASAPPASPPAASAPAAPASSSSGLAWPLTGTTLVGYNAPLAGRANQGINIAAAAGTPVRSAGAGTVAYAGNELRGYGNLVLIRHANNLVTAYAHLADINVSKDQTVAAGQVIGTVGQTGNVDQPQLHFEVREGSTPVDPARYLP